MIANRMRAILPVLPAQEQQPVTMPTDDPQAAHRALPPDWAARAQEELKGADAASLIWDTPEGIAVKPLYTVEDLEDP